jgi:hypothetical protein
VAATEREIAREEPREEAGQETEKDAG